MKIGTVESPCCVRRWAGNHLRRHSCLIVILAATWAIPAWSAPTGNGWDTDVIYVLRGRHSDTFPDGEIRMFDEMAPDPMYSDLGRFGADLPDDGKPKSICFTNSPTKGQNSPAGARFFGTYNYPPELNHPDPTDFIVVEYDVNANLLRRFYGSAGVGAPVGQLYGPNSRVQVGTIRYNPAKNTIAVSANVALNDETGSIIGGSQKGMVYEYELPDWPASTKWGTPTLVQRYEMPNPHNIAGDNGNIRMPLVIDFDNAGNMYATNKYFNATKGGPTGYGLYWGDVIRCNTLGLTGALSTHVIPVTGEHAGNLIIDARIEEQLGHTDYMVGGQALAVRAQLNQLVISPTIEPPTNVGVYDLTQRVGGGSTGNLVRLNAVFPSPRMAQFAQRDYDSGKIYIGNRSGDGPPGNFRYLLNDYPTDTLVLGVGYFLRDPCEPKCEMNKTWDAASPPFPVSTGPICFSDEFAYADGNLSDSGGWYGSSASRIRLVDQTVQIMGGAGSNDAAITVNCQDPGTGFIEVAIKIKSGLGAATMWSFFCDDPAGANLARWYGSGTTARGRIGGTNDVTDVQPLTGDWDELLVRIHPASDASEFSFNGTVIGILDHSVTGALDILGRLRFETIDNSGAAGQYVFLDDLIVGQPVILGDFDGDRDVDQEDFGHLQTCLSGEGMLYQSGCGDSDLDGDGDVDLGDVNEFLKCMAGPNHPPGC